MISRGQNFKSVELNVAGSSTFGRYPKISIEKTYNMYMSDGWLANYPGYKAVILSSSFGNGTKGRGIHTSTKLGKMIVVIGNGVYLVDLTWDNYYLSASNIQLVKIGTLLTSSGIVYITENNKPQICISDGTSIYIYDQTASPAFKAISTSFVPGYVDFHDTYFLCAAKNDLYQGATNTWRLSSSNDGTTWPDDSAHIGLIQTKPDNTQAVVRIPSRGNLINVLGSTVSEAWFDVGYQLFPYQRNTSYNIDYGCVSPATIAATDEMVVWLAQNEKSGPIIVYSDGGMPKKITTDGIDYLFSTFQNPADSRGFIFRQDGHLIYHINFYTDNVSLFYDFNTDKFYHACDENLNYFIADQVAFFKNQYYFITRNNGNLYAFDTAFTTFDGLEIPRFRTCKSIRMPSQEYFIVNDIGFTIETGETNYQQQDLGPIQLITEDGKYLITEGNQVLLITELGDYIELEDSSGLVISEQSDPTDFNFLISEQNANTGFSDLSLPRVDLSISTDGGETFGSDFGYTLNPIGKRKNKLLWWQGGIANDFTCQFKFWGLRRFVCTSGIVNIRQ